MSKGACRWWAVKVRPLHSSAARALLFTNNRTRNRLRYSSKKCSGQGVERRIGKSANWMCTFGINIGSRAVWRGMVMGCLGGGSGRLLRFRFRRRPIPAAQSPLCRIFRVSVKLQILNCYSKVAPDCLIKTKLSEAGHSRLTESESCSVQ